ncbi:uncharacterized protein PAS_chr1-4_0058 [Komagataella phaffii GS115]|uniref:Electron transfer flavoprotein-ubiquinone oxidoreductase n=1 Tax=Komagataella phaffii (strain GS115 / ATCC 20864) TaxID=644223 RepID=C4QXB5_KOMPG|nr:uncharacterized protein PAS_chr1-4_0058 [Komagataella phaffii GS115]CAY67888.1 Mitochondrial protein with similarity to flavoprotein-type oxidoreductases [Komagataella phaffii GS115]
MIGSNIPIELSIYFYSFINICRVYNNNASHWLLAYFKKLLMSHVMKVLKKSMYSYVKIDTLHLDSPYSSMLLPRISRISSDAIHRMSRSRIRAFSPYSKALRSFSTGISYFKEVPFSRMTEEEQQLLTEQRVVDHADVCVVGGGVAGLATAIRLKQLDNKEGYGTLRVVVLEKAPDMGSHIVSGAVLEPRGLRELFYTDDGIPLPDDMVTLVEEEHMRFLVPNDSFPVPEPPQMTNVGKNYIVSLSEVTKYLSERAEKLGVELYSGISVDELVIDDASNSVIGVATKDMGIGKDGVPNDDFERGMQFNSKLTVLAEGCHGSLSKKAIKKYNLRDGRNPQTYGLGLKEVWEVKPENFKKGYVGHTMGYPLSEDVYGGGFQYHFGDGLVTVGLVVGLDYKNPWISPYQEFQKLKHHPFYSSVLKGVGASAGFMNVPKIKGSHTAIKSGILAAESAFKALQKQNLLKTVEEVEKETILKEEAEERGDEYTPLDGATALELRSYEEAFKDSWLFQELYEVRNVRPSFSGPFKLLGGLAFSGLVTLFTKGREPFTLNHHNTDAYITENAALHPKIVYPKPDGEISFDILTSVSRTGTYHKEDERCHLRIPSQDYGLHTERLYKAYRGIENRFCPAGVYEYIPDESKKDGVKFQINAQNCIHCKTCDIKIPTQTINWEVPEGGDGPKYQMT